MLKAVLFDLDDTLVDHQFSSHHGLLALTEQYECLRQPSFESLKQAHADCLEIFHEKAIQGLMSLEAARVERFQYLFAHYGSPISKEEAIPITTLFREAYLAAERVIPGALGLLEHLKSQNIKIGIVTNSVIVEQVAKLKRCALEHLIDVMVTAEEAGTAKPAPAIFQMALDRLQCQPADVLMVGDNWWADVVGANQLGIRTLWLNRYGEKCPDRALATEFTTYEPLDPLLKLMFPA